MGMIMDLGMGAQYEFFRINWVGRGRYVWEG